MSIETKYNVGDELYTIDGETMKLVVFNVKRISISVGELNRVWYCPDRVSYKLYDENRCFPSEEELMAFMKEPIRENGTQALPTENP